MGNTPLTLLPPQNWQDFETLLKGVVDVIWQDEGWQVYGRPGQSQQGFDLFGYDEGGRFSVIQCKKKKPMSKDGELLKYADFTEKNVRAEIVEALKKKDPKIERFIFATTAARDVKTQDLVMRINSEMRKKSRFPVEIWFWEDIQIKIEQHHSLMQLYCSDYLEKIHKYDKNIHILTLLRQAFSRPAFRRVIGREESGADFLQAIKDTQEAILTGRLYNRRGHLLTTSHEAQKLSKKKWRLLFDTINDRLATIRNIYQDGVRSKDIREYPGCIDFTNQQIPEKLNDLRKESLIILNSILTEANIELVKSELLR